MTHINTYDIYIYILTHMNYTNTYELYQQHAKCWDLRKRSCVKAIAISELVIRKLPFLLWRFAK